MAFLQIVFSYVCGFFYEHIHVQVICFLISGFHLSGTRYCFSSAEFPDLNSHFNCIHSLRVSALFCQLVLWSCTDEHI
jgi:hypothetical protein